MKALTLICIFRKEYYYVDILLTWIKVYKNTFKRRKLLMQVQVTNYPVNLLEFLGVPTVNLEA